MCELGGGRCKRVVYLPDYLEHLFQKHYLVPNVGHQFSGTVIIYEGNLSGLGFADPSQNPELVFTYEWNPKWIRAFSQDFLFMMTRMRPGIWSAWVWLLGNVEQAMGYRAKIQFMKAGKCLGGAKYQVLPIRMPARIIEDSGNCFQVSDKVMDRFSRIGDNFITSEPEFVTFSFTLPAALVDCTNFCFCAIL